MKQFFKFMLASMLGFIIGSIVIFFLFFIMLVSVASFSSKKEEVRIKPNSVLKLKLDYPIQERTSENPFENFNISNFKSQKNLGLNDIIKNIKKAKEDKDIKGIYLEISDIGGGMATIEEIRNALLDFKKSGKFIISYGEIITQKAYYLATASDKIYMMPEGLLMFSGLSAQMMFLKGTMDKLEVEPQIIRHGKFKSAIEPLIYDKMSEANRMQTLTYLNSLWNQILIGISKTRGIEVSQLNLIADSLYIRKPVDAKKYKMVDSIIYYDGLEALLKSKIGIKEKDDIHFVSLSKYNNVPEIDKKYRGRNKIAIIYASGEINSGSGDEKNIYSDDLASTIRDARADSSIKAVVFRVNSPGGSALASEVILREVLLTKAAKPFVVSFGDVAASGGYYISCLADKIISNPNTITGSIGVFGVIPNMQKFFKDKLGVTFDVAKTNANSDLGSVVRPMSGQEKQIVQAQVEDIYNTFVTHVANGRKMTNAQVDSIGQGRVWAGTDALKIGLVDEIGGIDKAIEVAASLAKLKEYRIVELPKQKDFLTMIFNDMNENISLRIVQKFLGSNYSYFEYMNKVTKMNGIQARLPYEVEIY